MPTTTVSEAFAIALQHHQAGRLGEAEALYRQIVAAQPNHPEAWHHLGVLAHQCANHDLGIEWIRHSLALAPNNAAAYSNLGTTLRYRGHTDEAIIACRRAIELKPDYPDALLNLGNALKDKMRLSEAVDSFQRALALNPGMTGARTGLALTEWLMGHHREAEAGLREVVAKEADSAQAHVNLGYLLLLLGCYEEGWREHEWRLRLPGKSDALRPFAVPQWDGKPASGQTLLLHAEQGYGDTLQFIRYAPLAAERVGRVIVECQPGLKSLLAGIDGVSEVIERGEPLPAFDLHLPLMSLPHAFGTRLETIPAPVAFLRADAEKTAQWKTRIEREETSTRAGHPSRNRPLKVGLVWAGDARPLQAGPNVIDRRRSMHLRQLSSLAKVPGVVFVSLQKGSPATEAQNPPEGMTLLDWTDELHNFADTATLVEALDLVISADTSVVHLAGALGKPVWVLNRFDSCWRWLLDRDDSPWYPTVRLFRQPAAGDWDAVVENVARELGRKEAPPLTQ